MNAGGIYAISTFLAGVLLLLGWAYLTAGNPRSGAIFRKSVLLFVVPIAFAPVGLFRFSFGMLVLVTCEETLKAFASTRERNAADRFWLVSLFGIWELTLDKPFLGFVLAKPGLGLDSLALAGLICGAIVPVLMHAVTAGIYAFCFKRRLWVAFVASWSVHVIFNESSEFFALSLTADLLKTAILASMLWTILWRLRRRQTVSND